MRPYKSALTGVLASAAKAETPKPRNVSGDCNSESVYPRLNQANVPNRALEIDPDQIGQTRNTALALLVFAFLFTFLIFIASLRSTPKAVFSFEPAVLSDAGAYVIGHGDGLWATLAGTLVALLGISVAQKVTEPTDEAFARIRLGVGFAGVLIGSAGVTLGFLVAVAVATHPGLLPSLVVQIPWSVLVVTAGALMGRFFNATNQDRLRSARANMVMVQRLNQHLGTKRRGVSEKVASRCRRRARREIVASLIPGSVLLVVAAVIDPINSANRTATAILTTLACLFLVSTGGLAVMYVIAMRRSNPRRWQRAGLSVGLSFILLYEVLFAFDLGLRHWPLGLAALAVVGLSIQSMRTSTRLRNLPFFGAGRAWAVLALVSAAEATALSRGELVDAERRVAKASPSDLRTWLANYREN